MSDVLRSEQAGGSERVPAGSAGVCWSLPPVASESRPSGVALSGAHPSPPEARQSGRIRPLPFLGEWWLPTQLGDPFAAAGVVPTEGFDGKWRFVGVRYEERDGVPGLVVSGDPAHPPSEDDKHLGTCRVCGLLFDMRHLDQVFAHEHDGPHEATGIIGERVQ